MHVRVWTNANMVDDNPWFLFRRDGRQSIRFREVSEIES